MIDRDDLEVLKQLTGSQYERQRDDLLQSIGLGSRLANLPRPVGWQEAVTRDILGGWIAHGALYRRVLSEFDAIDVAHESRKVTGIAGVWENFAARAAAEYKTDILPLCWEVILKHFEDWPDWKVIAFLRATAAVPKGESIDPVLWLLQRTKERQLQDVAGQTLERLPKEAVIPRLEQLDHTESHLLEVLRDVKGRAR